MYAGIPNQVRNDFLYLCLVMLNLFQYLFNNFTGILRLPTPAVALNGSAYFELNQFCLIQNIPPSAPLALNDVCLLLAEFFCMIRTTYQRINLIFFKPKLFSLFSQTIIFIKSIILNHFQMLF